MNKIKEKSFWFQGLTRRLNPVIFIISIVCSQIYSQASLGGNREAVEILHLKGKILFRHPIGTRWIKLRPGSKVPVGSLLQVTENSEVKLKIAADLSRSYRAKELIVNIQEPIIIRLSQNILRSVKFDPTYLHKMPKVSVPERADLPLLMDISDAWQRVTAVFSGRQKTTDSFLESKKDINIAIRSDEIQILSPLPSEYLVMNYFPLGFKLVWKKPSSFRGRFIVYFWNSSSGSRQAIAATKEDYYTARIPTQGTYFVKIESENGHYQSKLHRIVVLNERQKSSKREDPVAKKIDLSFPKNNAVIRLSKNGLVDFIWKTNFDSQLTKTQYSIIITRINSKKIQSTPSKTTQFSINLPPGNYSWRVESKTDSQVLVSQRRNLQVALSRNSSDDRNFAIVLKKIFEQPENGQIILD